MNIEIDKSFTHRVLREIVACDSVNPAFPGADGAPGQGEAAVAQTAGRILREIGIETHLHEASPGRPSVAGILRGRGGGRSLMLNGHIDTVGPGDMRTPFEPKIESGRLYGRGAYDMKGGVAACISAAQALHASGLTLSGDVVLALVADEEKASLGTQDLLRRYPVDGAIVTEPTELDLALAHKGFTWVRITTSGVAYHGSMWEHGVDANLRMGKILAALAEYEKKLLKRDRHPLLGPPSMHAALLSGGIGPSVYCPESTLQLERRTLPGESPEQVVAEIEEIVLCLEPELPRDAVKIELVLSRSPFEAAAESSVARCVQEVHAQTTGSAPEVSGVSYWADAAFLRDAGFDTVLYGPAGEGAHADVEWVDLESVEICARTLAEVAWRYCNE